MNSTAYQLIQRLDEALKTTGFPYRSLPFIHGALTACAVLPDHAYDDYDDNTMKDAFVCTVVFDIKDRRIPKKGIDDHRVTQVLEWADSIKSNIINDLNKDRYEPFFGEYQENTPDREIPKEWCRGFIGAMVLAIDLHDIEEMPDETATAFGIIIAYAQPDDKKLLESIKSLEENLTANSTETITECVYEIDTFRRECEANRLEDDDFYPDDLPETPFVNENPKTGRNDPCPCGSGKKYKKCRGKNA